MDEGSTSLIFRKRHQLRLASAAFVLVVLLPISAWAAPGKDFAIVALPDTQFYSESFPKIFEAQTDWIVANRSKLNIVYVAHLGDITNQGDSQPIQWTNARSALYRLENPATTGLSGGIPYGVVPGNHDHVGGTQCYNSSFGVDHFSGRSYYGGHFGRNNNSHFDVFTEGGLPFIVLYIDFSCNVIFYPTLDSWAAGVLRANADRRAIVVSHNLLSVNGSFDPRGWAIYNKLKPNPNLFLMLCGHHHGVARRYDVYKGRAVVTCLSDFQSAHDGGDGYLRIYRFSPAKNLVRVQTYSPWLNEYKDDPSSQFEFAYQMDDRPLDGLGVLPPQIGAVVP